MNDVIWSIYKITNTINNKIYIGQTKNVKARWSRHKYNAKLNNNTNNHLYNAMRKYGLNNFLFEIIIQTKCMEEVDKLEIFMIDQYQSIDKNIGYNNSPGGHINKLVSVETRQKLSKALQGRVGTMLGKFHSTESKKLISQANKGKKNRLGVKVSDDTKKLLSHINIGKKATEETKKKMSQSMIGKNAGNKNGMFGRRTVNAKLTQEQAKSIRNEYVLENISMLNLSIKYNVSKRTIFNIIHNTIYKE